MFYSCTLICVKEISSYVFLRISASLAKTFCVCISVKHYFFHIWLTDRFMPIVWSYYGHESSFYNGNISRDLIFNTQSLPYRGHYQAFKHNELRNINLNMSFYFIYFSLFMHFYGAGSIIQMHRKSRISWIFRKTYCEPCIFPNTLSNKSPCTFHTRMHCRAGEKKHYLTPNP